MTTGVAASTWNDAINGPHRPGLSDFNGIGLVDDAISPPANDGTMPTSAVLNCEAATTVSTGSMVPNLTVSVASGVGPTFYFVASAISAITLVAGLVVTRVSAGIYWVTWTSNAALPAQVANDKAYINATLGAHTYGIGVVRGTFNPGGGVVPGVKVTTVIDGALADIDFTVDVM
jgi:hypothetical protein